MKKQSKADDSRNKRRVLRMPNKDGKQDEDEQRVPEFDNWKSDFNFVFEFVQFLVNTCTFNNLMRYLKTKLLKYPNNTLI